MHGSCFGAEAAPNVLVWRAAGERVGLPNRLAMNLGVRGILLAVAILLFVIAVFSETNWDDLVAWGLAATAAGLLVEELGIGTRFTLGRNRRS